MEIGYDETIDKLRGDINEFESVIFVSMNQAELLQSLKSNYNLRFGNRKTKIVQLKNDDEIEKLYLTYNFSSKVKMIRDSLNYGTCLNYIKAGVITPEDYIDIKTSL